MQDAQTWWSSPGGQQLLQALTLLASAAAAWLSWQVSYRMDRERREKKRRPRRRRPLDGSSRMPEDGGAPEA